MSVPMLSVPVLLSAHSSQQCGPLLYCRRGDGGLLKERSWVKYVPVSVLCLAGCKGTRGLWPLGFPPCLRDGLPASPGANHADRFWAALRSPVWKLAPLPRQQRGRLFRRNILSFSLIHCSWRFGSLLLNCSCHSYPHLYQQQFQRHSPCISRAPPPPPSCLLLGGCVLLLYPQYQTCKCAQLCLLCRSSQPSNILLKSLFASQNTKWFLPPVKATIEHKALVPSLCIGSGLGHVLLVTSRLWYPVVTL